MRFIFGKKPPDTELPLADIADYLEEMRDKPLAERKSLWWSLIGKEGLQMADEIGTKLGVEDTVISEWIREWIHNKQHQTDSPSPDRAMAISEVYSETLESSNTHRLPV